MKMQCRIFWLEIGDFANNSITYYGIHNAITKFSTIAKILVGRQCYLLER